jgi:hypothetical protein
MYLSGYVSNGNTNSRQKFCCPRDVKLFLKNHSSPMVVGMKFVCIFVCCFIV